MYALRAHIKLFIFRNIFSGIKKTVITFSIIENFFSKIGNPKLFISKILYKNRQPKTLPNVEMK